MFLDPAEGSWACSAHRFRADGTNVRAHKGCAVQTCEVFGYYDICGRTASCTVWPDIQVIDGKSGVDCYALTRRQCNLVGSPIYGQPPVTDGCKVVERWLLAVTDDGPDQKGNRKMLRNDFHNRERELFIELGCLQHSASNGAKKALARGYMVSTASWGLPAYFSSLAKLANVLRMKFHKVKQAWHEQFLCDDACDMAMRTKCPKPISTRWFDVGHGGARFALAEN